MKLLVVSYHSFFSWVIERKKINDKHAIESRNVLLFTLLLTKCVSQALPMQGQFYKNFNTSEMKKDYVD